MAVANNADDYANPRQNIYFPGVTPDLDGQCVSLVKGFLQDMTGVPNPQAARGDARYMGHTLVSQGHAVEIPYSERRRGDVICYEYGTYGHTGVVLSGDRTFEENVNWSGVASKIVDGARVYASRIGSLGESWRHDQHVYRINTYNEGGTMSDAADGYFVEACAEGFLNRGAQGDQNLLNNIGRPKTDVLETFRTYPEAQQRQAQANAYPKDAIADKDAVTYLWKAYFDRVPTAKEYTDFVGKTYPYVIWALTSADEYKQRQAHLQMYWEAYNSGGKVTRDGAIKYINDNLK